MAPHRPLPPGCKKQSLPLTRGLEKGLGALLFLTPGAQVAGTPVSVSLPGAQVAGTPGSVSLWHEAWPSSLEPGCRVLGSAPAVPHDPRLSPI